MPEYVESLEKEITELKSKNRTLRQRMEEVASKASKPPPYGRSELPGTQAQDPFIQAHIKELNGAVGNNNNNNNDNSYTNDKQLLDEVFVTGKINGYPFLDILGYLKNTHKNPKFGKVRQVPTREFPTKFPGWDLSHSSKFGIFVGIL